MTVEERCKNGFSLNRRQLFRWMYHRSERRNENTRKHLKEGKSETSVSDFFL